MSASPYKTIIIDDEPPALQRLRELLANFSDTFEIVGQAASGREAITTIEELDPDLIFLDIQMPGMTGFEMLQQLKKIPLVIFCTAYDQYSLKAFETNSVDYLLKPVKLERLEQTVAKLKFFKKDFSPEKILGLLKELSSQGNHKPMTSITVRNGKKLVFIKLDEIVYFEASDKYVTLFTRKGEKHLTEQPFHNWKKNFPHIIYAYTAP